MLTRSGAVTTGSAMTLSATHRFEVRWEVSDGLLGDVTANKQGPAGLAGLTADAVTKTLAEARMGGLWGPGAVTVSGERFFIPPVPRQINYYDALRAALMEHAVAGDVIGVIGDSIPHFSAAPTGAEHQFNQLTRFANLGVAADEPIMTALRPSSTYVPTFYGVTVTGGSTGTAGPLGESLVLADGDDLEFTGTYETVGGWFEQKASQGSLVITRDGTPLTTISASGTVENDRFTGQIATGVTASATYRFAASGGSVELTGLLRLGVKAAGSGPRLRFGRFAHGSYMFSSFNAPRRASILKQSTYAGGKLVALLSLGINDFFVLSPATIVANATALIDDLVAGGVEAFYGYMPMRPTSAWDPNYTGGRTYDSALGPLRRLYRERGVIPIPTDMIDFGGRGLFADGLHPNGPGQPVITGAGIETFITAANRS